MHIRTFARTVAAAGALAASLSLMTPALAADAPGADIARGAMPPPPAMPAVPPPPQLPDARPDWNGPRPDWRGPPPPQMMGPAPVVMQVDPRTRDIWLSECRRRMDTYYGGGWDDDYGWKRHRRHHRDRDRDRDVRDMGYDYCTAYFDDYYQHYAQAGYAYGPMMRTVAPAGPPQQHCVTEEHVSYVPVRTRYIPRRHDKRIPDKRIRLQGS